MKIDKFHPPGNLEDLSDDGRKAWSEWISAQIDAARDGDPQLSFDGPREQFFNPTKTEIAEDFKVVDITWTAFPRQVALAAGSDLTRWRMADGSRDTQDEYCEWSVSRNADDKITSVAFTCEGPEYWQFLGATQPDTLLDLYRAHISPNVRQEDLFTSGRYKSRNRWNNSTQNGAMHLIQRSNSLSAEIELAGGASVVREIDGVLLTQEQDLIECGQYGVAERNSDPSIGAIVNSVSRQKADVTLADPIGLYFSDLLVTPAWKTPDGSNAKDCWRYTRGDNDHPVRAVFEVPKEKGFIVGDITIKGQGIRFGAQIADFINMKLVGIGCRFGKSTVRPLTGCRGQEAAAAFAVSEVLRRPERRSRTN